MSDAPPPFDVEGWREEMLATIKTLYKLACVVFVFAGVVLWWKAGVAQFFILWTFPTLIMVFNGWLFYGGGMEKLRRLTALR